MNIEQKQRQAINMLLEIEKMYGSDVPCSLVSVLLMIPLSGQIPVTEIRKQSTLTEAGVSRAVSTLNAHNVSNRREIDKLVEILIDDKDRRYRLLELTEKGRHFVRSFLSHLLEGSQQSTNQ